MDRSPLLLAFAMLLLALAPGRARTHPVPEGRPYEMVWANRTEPEHEPLLDFEDLSGWQVTTENAEATLTATDETLLWGDRVGKLTYRATGASPKIRLEPPAPLACPPGFDTITFWILGNNWAYRSDPTTPPVNVNAVFRGAGGNEVSVWVNRVYWEYWFLLHRKLSAEQQAALGDEPALVALEITNGTNKEDRVLHFDNLAVFHEVLAPLTFEPRPQRGIDMFPGQTVGTNTGPGRLPFPTRPETILPTNLTDDYTTALAADGDAQVLTYRGDDGTLTWRITPASGTFGDIEAAWQGRPPIRPGVGGGVWLVGPGGVPVAPEGAEHLGTAAEGDSLVSRWRLTAGDASADVTYTYRLWGKTLVIDVQAPGGQVAEVRYGRATGLENPRVVQVPYYNYTPGRPHVAVSGSADAPLFLLGNSCWYLSNASQLYGDGAVGPEGVAYNGGTRYIPKTDGTRNDVYERLFLTLSPRFEEVLPNIPNPPSPYRDITGTGVWRAYGAGNRENDATYWRRAHRYGMTELIVTDHETMWRDGGESFTFRTKAAPGKGGDEGAFEYARIMQDELGFVYGPYNNFTDFAPVNEYWSADRVNRTPDGQLQTAWPRCYAPKPTYAIEAASKIPYILEDKFHFSTAYCDVHTAVPPWRKTDYDARVPGAGTFTAVVYSYGEIMLHQREAWGGPVYSEGNHHCFLHGLTDGNYAQDQNARLQENPWLVDFDLRKMHDLGSNFGMGNLEMFYGRDVSPGQTEQERNLFYDRFLAATVAFGHTGFLMMDGGLHNGLRSYYMLQQLAADYSRQPVDTIRYVAADGRLLDTSTAVAGGAFARSQLVNSYADGLVTVANGSLTERLRTTVSDRELDLPPGGYAGWSTDGSIDIFAGEVDGHRIDYATTPAYLYIDGRGRFTRMAKAAGDGIGICRTLDDGYEIILYQGADAGFALPAGLTATALAEDRSEMGPAEVRTARGLTYVMPVEGAFSYKLTAAGDGAQAGLESDRDEVVPGESVTVRGPAGPFEVAIAADATPGQRVWHQANGAWIDFTVVPLAATEMALADGTVRLTASSNLAATAPFTVTVGDASETVELPPGEPITLDLPVALPRVESMRPLTVELRSGDLRADVQRVLRTVHTLRDVARVPAQFTPGMTLRGQAPTTDPGAMEVTRARADAATALTVGNVTKQKTADRPAIFMHPPYLEGTGAVFALLDPVALPAAPPAAFRASVGKRDGSDLGDGILFKVAVVDAAGAETVVAEQRVDRHVWLPIEADLSPWAGQTVRLKLISDVGAADNSSGDWASWADLRIETLTPELQHSLHDGDGRYATADPPIRSDGLTVADLRRATRAWVHYDGIGLEGGTGNYGSEGLLNDVELGPMAGAGGSERDGAWAENVSLEIPAEALATLGPRNVFRLHNPREDWFKVRRFWIELELPGGRKASSRVSTIAQTQPPGWPYAEGLGVPHGEDITYEIWFDVGE